MSDTAEGEEELRAAVQALERGQAPLGADSVLLAPAFAHRFFTAATVTPLLASTTGTQATPAASYAEYAMLDWTEIAQDLHTYGRRITKSSTTAAPETPSMVAATAYEQGSVAIRARLVFQELLTISSILPGAGPVVYSEIFGCDAFLDDVLMALFVGLPAVCDTVSLDFFLAALARTNEGDSVIVAWTANRPGYATSVLHRLSWLHPEPVACKAILRLCRVFPTQAEAFRFVLQRELTVGSIYIRPLLCVL